MSDFEVKIDAAELEARLSAISRRLPEEGKRAESESAVAQVDALREAVPQRTGAIARSFDVEPRDGGTAAVSRHPGAGFLDHGGTIRPVSRRALTIPFSGSGSRERIGNLLIVRPAHGRALLASISKGRFDPQFTLVDQTTARGREYIAAARRAAEKRINDAAIRAAIRAAEARRS